MCLFNSIPNCCVFRLQLALIERRANLDLKDLEGNTAAHWAFAMGFNDLGDFLISKGASDRISNSQGYACRSWRRQDAIDGAVNSTPTHVAHSPKLVSPSHQSTGSPGHRSSTEKERSGVHLPSLSPQKESNNILVPAYKQDPRPAGGRARKKVRTRDIEPTVYQRMYLAFDEPERSQSTPPIGRHESDERPNRPSSSRGRLDSVQPEDLNESFDNSGSTSPPFGPPQLKVPHIGAQKKASKTPKKPPKVTIAPEEPDDNSGLLTLMKFVKDGAGTINEPFSLEAMRKLGLVQEQLVPIDKTELKRKFKDDKIVELRYKLMEDRRNELLKRVLEERRRLRARSKDASLEELFIEYAGDMQMNISEFMEMLSKLGLLSEGGDKPGRLGKTHATNIFKAFAIRIGPTFEITWEQFTKMEKQISADLGIKSIRCPEEKVKQKQPITTPGRNGIDVMAKHNYTMEDRLELIRKKMKKITKLSCDASRRHLDACWRCAPRRKRTKNRRAGWKPNV